MKKLLTTLAVGAALVAGGIGAAVTAGAPVAQADQYDYMSYQVVTCNILDGNPTPTGVDGAGAGLMSAGFSQDQAADIIVNAVRNVCPEYMSLLRGYSS